MTLSKVSLNSSWLSVGEGLASTSSVGRTEGQQVSSWARGPPQNTGVQISQEALWVVVFPH